MMYQPKTIDTTDIELPVELEELTELLAKNTHENWAAERIHQGWTWGPERNDQKKTTPCLVPYEELAESEKRYDRNTSIETLKVILALGFRIER